MLIKVIRQVHKILGLVLSVLFLMWFISGIVMIYHSFPRISPTLKWERQEALSPDLPAIDTLLKSLPDSVELRGISVDMYRE